MGILSGLAGIIKGGGEAVSKTWSTIKGDKGARDEALHKEQLAVIDQFAKEFVARPQATWWDSFVDGLNRLPRPLITFSIFGIFWYAFYDPLGFVLYMQAFSVVPDELWFMWTSIVAFWFGSRIISEDIRKPKITTQQVETAKEIIKERAKAAEAERAARVEEMRPATRKPPQPEWAPPEPTPADRLPDIPQDQQGNAAIDAMIADLIRREGGFVDDPADSGGPTCWGITQRTLSAWRETSCSIDDVKSLTQAEAAKIYRAEYYLLPRFDVLPVALQGHVFDIGVNCGPRTAVRMLQQALNVLGSGIVEDGVMGPATMAAIAERQASDINRELVKIRMQYYANIITRNPKNQKFANGWNARAKLFLKEAA